MPFQYSQERKALLFRNLGIYKCLRSIQPLAVYLLSRGSNSCCAQQRSEIQQLLRSAGTVLLCTNFPASAIQDVGRDQPVAGINRMWFGSISRQINPMN